MASENLAMEIFLFSQIMVGMIGNSSILLYYIILISTGKLLRATDRIIEHLVFANCLYIISKGIPQTLSYYGIKDFLDDIGCKLINYIYRITRGQSLYAMCLLSCFQAITISPSNSRWMMLKHRATKYLGPSCSVGWLVQLFLNIMTPIEVSRPMYIKNVTNWKIYEYCSWFASGNVGTGLYMFLLCSSDGLCLGLMACSSVSMVSILHRHKKQVKYIHSSQYLLSASPENRATQSILILVFTFVISYSFSSIMVIFMAFSKYPMLLQICVTFLESCFPIVCPFVLMRTIKPSFSLILSCFCKR
ncbi:vomeronasal type-1 receptor 4-like [Arvicanthis niloticus]|uniref:vomeronasal type-1 receptor 4-like n=1 Tax=Arvicanthis niloticus TaxID=61156 RepID=UPI0014875443|nr:vomeronasal type-1 receptor 4-like [Arvicanthis niloticus]